MLRQAIKKQHQGDLSAAESICHSIISQYPDSADAMQLLGVLYNQTGKTDTAIQWLSRAIRQHPTNPDLYNTLGILLKSSGDLKKRRVVTRKR